MPGESANLAGFHEVRERAVGKTIRGACKVTDNKDQRLKWRRVTRMMTLTALQETGLEYKRITGGPGITDEVLSLIFYFERDQNSSL